MNVRFVWVTGLLAAACAHLRKTQQCWDAEAAFPLALDGGVAARIRQQNAGRLEDLDAGRLNAEDVTAQCRDDFGALVKSAHCSALLDAYCDTHCGADAGDCRAGIGRIEVRQRCWQEAAAAFLTGMKTCAHMQFVAGPGRNDLYLPDGGG